ncbi:hypothetical protein EMIT0111MI5_20392 [Burkholderia sp. IT-111MI5]
MPKVSLPGSGRNQNQAMERDESEKIDEEIGGGFADACVRNVRESRSRAGFGGHVRHSGYRHAEPDQCRKGG